MKKITCYNTVVSLTIRHYRDEAKKSQKYMAEQLGITAAGWGKFEKGYSTISASKVLQICDILNIPYSDFYKSMEETKLKMLEEGWIFDNNVMQKDDALLEVSASVTPKLLVLLGGPVFLPLLLAISGYEFYKKLKDSTVN